MLRITVVKISLVSILLEKNEKGNSDVFVKQCIPAPLFCAILRVWRTFFYVFRILRITVGKISLVSILFKKMKGGISEFFCNTVHKLACTPILCYFKCVAYVVSMSFCASPPCAKSWRRYCKPATR